MKRVLLFLSILLALSFTACEGKEIPEESVLVEENVDEVSSYFDSKDQSIISSVNTIKKTISFYNYDLGKGYTLEYDALTTYKDKYGTPMSVEQLTPGTVVDIEFLKKSKRLTALAESSGLFKLDNLTGFKISENKKTFTYKEDVYKITGRTILLGEKNVDSVLDLDPVDVVTICGKDSEIYSLVVEKSHGTLEIQGFEDFVGGELVINESVSHRIGDNFKVVLPEGIYKSSLKKDLTEEAIDFEIKAGEVTKLDLSSIELVESRYGKVLFNASPKDLELYIDGNLTDTKLLQTLSYGTHRLEAYAEGYGSIKRYFKVGEEKATLDVTLEALEGEAEEEAEEDSSNTDGYFIFVSEPKEVEIYVDGIYIGMSPVSLKKQAGSHTVVLKKAGYYDRTYTIKTENTAKDDYYTFGELEKKADSGAENGDD
jgi:hypothetical protein